MINGQAVEILRIEAGYVVLERVWQPGDVVELALTMEAGLIEPHPRIDAVRDSVAIQRDPLVYCLEAVDLADVNLMDLQIDEMAPLHTVWREDLIADSLMVIQASGYVLEDGDWQNKLYRPLKR